MAEGNWGSAGMHKVDIRNDLQLVKKLQRRAREGGSPFAVQSSPAACTAGTGQFLRRKIPFSRAKIASLQFPRPKIRRILAETGRGGSGGEACSPATSLSKRLFDKLMRACAPALVFAIILQIGAVVKCGRM